MTDLVDIFLPASPPSKKSPTEGEIHISYDSGKSTLILLVPNREEVHKVLYYKYYFCFVILILYIQFLLQRKENFDSNIKPENHGIRPADVPGRILNMALLNIGSEDPGLRLAAYHLLYSLSISFRFSVAHQLMSARGKLSFLHLCVRLLTLSETIFLDLCIPFNSVDFTRRISENLAASEAHLTLEFLNECIVGYNRSSTESARQLLTLEYMVPWLRNLVLFIHMPVKKEASKVKDVIRSLIVITAEKSEVSSKSELLLTHGSLIFCIYIF
jgi:neurofibromin 1